MWVQGIGLKDHGDIAVLGGDVIDDAIADAHHAVADLLQAGEHPEGRRFAGTGGTDQDDELLVLDLGVHVSDDSVSGVALVYVLVSDAGHCSSLGGR